MFPASLLLSLINAALCFSCQSTAATQPAPEAASATLSCVDGRLSLTADGEEQVLAEDSGCRSFTVNEAADCLVLTSLDDNLLPESWVLGPARNTGDALHLPGQLLQYKGAAFLAFADLPDPLLEFSSRLSIVNRDGRISLVQDDAWLLSALSGEHDPAEACLLHWSGLTGINELFSSIEIMLVSSVDGSLQENWQPALPQEVADVELLYLDEQAALILVQYDIYTWQILRLNRGDGAVEAVFSLNGQPMYDRLLPSGEHRLSRLAFSNGLLELDVFSFEDENLRISIDPLTGEYQQTNIPGIFPVNRNQPMIQLQNSAMHLSLYQQLIPLKMGRQWDQPAWIDQSHRLLLLEANGPCWIQIR